MKEGSAGQIPVKRSSGKPDRPLAPTERVAQGRGKERDGRERRDGWERDRNKETPEVT